MKRVVHRPQTLNVEAFARDAAELTGTRALEQFKRLAGSTVARLNCSDAIAWRARGELRTVHTGPPQVWLHLGAAGEVDLECQRCLEPMRWVLRTESSVLFVAGEEAAAALDAESEHDVLALTPWLDLFDLLEDELLLALPLIARHAACPKTDAAVQAPGVQQEPQEDSQPHPFAVLAALKRGRAD